MDRDIAEYQQWLRSRFYESQRHTIELDYVKYMDELATLVGCRPPLCALFEAMTVFCVLAQDALTDI